MRLPRLLLVVLALAAWSALHQAGTRPPDIRPAFSSLAAATEGSFPLDGAYPGEPFATTAPVRTWGSWAGNDAHTGSLRLGPFTAGDRLRFAASGYPARDNNAVHLERASTGERHRIQIFNIGERWTVLEHAVPFPWRGEPIYLVATDAAQGHGGWLGLSEPLDATLPSPLALLLAAALLNAALLGALALAAARLLAPRTPVAAPWLPLLALAVVAALGYLAFWAFLAHPLAGKVFTAAILLAAAAILARPPRAPFTSEQSAALRDVALLTAGIALLYFAALHLFFVPWDFYPLAANRFRHDLPVDNYLPALLSGQLYAGERPGPGGDWLSSDRPPLQTGWQLLTLWFTDLAGLPASSATGSASILFQLSWVAAVYGLLRTLGLTPRRAVAWTAILSLSGFFLQNSVFTWPKLSAAAFAVAALTLWFAPAAAPAPPHFQRSTFNFQLAAPAALAALAWLSHGGVAFSFLVVAPLFLWRLLRGHARAVLCTALVFFTVAAPWLAYQKFYDPPGNRLLKWHLGGQVAPDARGTWQTIRENYAALGWRDALAARRANLAQQFEGSWSRLFEFHRSGAHPRQVDEFFHVPRALGWWIFGLLTLPFLWFRPVAPPLRRLHLIFAGTTIATVLVWCALLFIPRTAVLHHGSYAVPLVAFALLSVWLDHAHRFTVFALALLQAATFATTWLPASAKATGPVSPLAVTVLLTAVALLLLAIRRAAPRAARNDFLVDSTPSPRNSAP